MLDIEQARQDRVAGADLCKPLENAVLAVLPGQHEHGCFGYEFYHSLSVISQDAGMDKEAARFACRRLRDKGLAIFRRGLFTEDGEVAGSGYALTDAGRAALSEIEAPAADEIAALKEQVARLEREREKYRDALAILPSGEWETWTSCSFRRISTRHKATDGDVLHALNQKADGHPDISWTEKQCDAICEIVNGLRSDLATTP